jgi:cytochrome c-type biogenesis protein CcmF
MKHLITTLLIVALTHSLFGQQDVVLNAGDTVQWAGRTVRLARVNEQVFPDKIVAEAELDIFRGDVQVATLLPAQHFHRLTEAWTTEVAIDSTWHGDFYVILHSGEGNDQVQLTLIDNPMMRWMWMGGWIAGAGTLIRLWPRRRRSTGAASLPVSDRQIDSTAARRAMAASLLVACVLNATVLPPLWAGTPRSAATADETTD